MRPVDIPAVALSVPRTPRVDAVPTAPVQDQSGRQLAEVGVGVAQLGGGVASLMRQKQDELDTVRTREADNRAADEIRRALYDPKGGYLTKVGRSAMGNAREQTFNQLRDTLTKIEDGLDNDTQRGKFRLAVEDRLVDANLRADAHETDQRRAYGIGETKAGIDNGITDAVNAIGTPMFDKEAAAVMTLADELSDWMQGGPEEKKQTRLEVSTKLHSAVVEDLVRREQGEVASQYLKAVKAEVLPQERPKLDVLVERGVQHEQATKLTFELTKEARASVGYAPDATREQKVQTFLTAEHQRLMSLVAAREKLDTMFEARKVNAKVRDEVRDRLREMERDAKESAADQRISYIERAQQMLRDDPALSVDRLPDDLYVPLVALHGLDDLVTFQETRRTPTDPQVLLQVDNVDPNYLRSISRAEWRAALMGKLAPNAMNYAIAKWEAANDPEKNEPKQFITVRDRLRNFARLPAVGVLTDTNDPNKRRAEETAFEQLETKFNTKMLEWQAENKRKPTDTDVQKVLDEIAVDTVFLNRWGKDPEKPLWLTTADDNVEESAYIRLSDGTEVPYRELGLIPGDVKT